MDTRLCVVVGLCCGLALLIPRPVHDLLLYNPSRSIAPGFYLRIDTPPTLDAIVTVRAAEVALDEAKARRFDGPSDRFIKHVAALAGDEVCAEGEIIRINGAVRAVRQATDSAGRTLPQWQGCTRLEADEFFLLGETGDSFDSRYWGPVHRSRIEGVWRRL